MGSSPNPSWKPGDPIASPVKSMTTIDPSSISAREVYKLLIGCVVPRPIAFVSTVDRNGVGNLAPFSFFNALSSNPACIMISVSPRPDGAPKDTARNIEDTGEFVVNGAHQWLAEPLVHCGAAYPHGVDEMSKVGLTPIPSVRVKPPRVRESAVHFECKLYKSLLIGDGSPGSTTLFVGEVVQIHIHEPAYRDGRIDFKELKPIARLGGISYTSVENSFEIPIPEL